jgi:hypothetical protein
MMAGSDETLVFKNQHFGSEPINQKPETWKSETRTERSELSEAKPGTFP